MKKNLTLYIVLTLVCLAKIAHAATSVASFDPVAGALSVTGSCSGRYVLILIKDSSSGAIWGSSNPPCVNGAYSYSIAVPDSARTGDTFSVSAADNGVAPSAVSPSQSVVFSPAPDMDQTSVSSSVSASVPSITLETSSLENSADDVSFLDGIVQGFFGLATSALNAVESSVVAAVHLFAKIFTILPGGSIAVPSGPNEISGQGVLPAGATGTFVANTSVSSSSDIIITPTSPTQVPLSVMQIEDGSGFSVGAVSPQDVGVSFTWIIIDTYADSTSTPQIQQSLGGQSIVAVPPASEVTETPDASGDISTDTPVIATGTDGDASDTTVDTSSSDSVSADAGTAAMDATTTDTTDSGDAASTTATQ